MKPEPGLETDRLAGKVESVEPSGSPEVLHKASLYKLKTCLDFEVAAFVFLENPAAFTRNITAAVSSNTKLSEEGFAAYVSYLDLIKGDAAGARKEILLSRYAERPLKQGTDQHGNPFFRQERVPDKTMQVAGFLYPEIGFYVLKRGVLEGVLSLPEGITLTQMKEILLLFFSHELPENLETLKPAVEALNFTKEQLEDLMDFLKSLSGNLLRPLITDLVGESDLAVNIFISLGAKLEIYLMLK